MPPRPAPAWSFGAREGLLTMPTVLGHHGHDFVHLLDRQQPAEGPRVAWLAAALPAGGRRFRARRGLEWIRRWGSGGIRRVLPQTGFQFADARLQGGILRAQGGVLQPERRYLLQEWCWVRSRHRRPQVR